MTLNQLIEMVGDEGYAIEVLDWIEDPTTGNSYLLLAHPAGVPEGDHSRDYALAIYKDGSVVEIEVEDFHQAKDGGIR